MIQDFLIPFIATGIAELGDKTQLAVFCLAAKTKKYLQLLLGIILAFIIADGIAILFGDFINKKVPLNIIKIFSGILFIAIGIYTLIKKEEEAKCDLKTPFVSGFSLIFISELGDKTQIAAGLFATQYNPFMVFIGVILAETILSIIAIFFSKKIKLKTLKIIAGILFIVIGIFFLF